jgi:Domain of unknown function (DUF1929)
MRETVMTLFRLNNSNYTNQKFTGSALLLVALALREIRKISRLNLLLAAAFVFCCGRVAHAEQDLTFGSWAQGSPAPGHMLATHSTLLRNNKILVVSGSSYNCGYTWGKEATRFYDIATNSWSALLSTPAPYGSSLDAFCSGHAHDNVGRVIFQGGLLRYPNHQLGIDNSARYDPVSGTFTQFSGAAVHYYPTLVAGVNKMYIFPGQNTQPVPKTPEGSCIEKVSYGATSWTTTGVSFLTKQTYPRVSFLPSGKLFVASPADVNRKNYFFDPNTNTLSLAGNDVVPESEPGQVHCCQSWQGSGVLLPFVPSQGRYPHARFALINGLQAYVKDLQQPNPTWQVMGSRPPELGSPPPRRYFANCTMLPTGQVVVTGGVRPSLTDASAVKQAEIFDPETNNWLLTSAATVPRNYHGAALLLPDGRVWTAGGSKDHMGSDCGTPSSGDHSETRVEIFTPWYCKPAASPRPEVTDLWGCPPSPTPPPVTPPVMVTNGTPYDLGIRASQGTNIDRVVLIRAGSVTHAFDTDQRLIQLDILNKTASTVRVASPYAATVAIPGDYLLFALRPNEIDPTGFKRWVPSKGYWIRIASGGPAPTPSPTPPSTPTPTETPTPTPTGTETPTPTSTPPPTETPTPTPTGTETPTPTSPPTSSGIWSYTEPPCEDSCWPRLDNDPKTIAITTTGTAHSQILYQLHNDGSILRYTDTPCEDDSCTGWHRLDNDSKTIAIAADGDLLYQLQNDGWILRYSGDECDGDSCPGWQRRLGNNPKTIAITAGGGQLYQLQNDGWILRYTGVECDGDSCPGWERLDNNSKTIAITANGGQLYQLQNDGGILHHHTGTRWERLGNNSKTIAITANGNRLYQLQNDHSIWHYTGTGWLSLPGYNSKTVAVAATGSGLLKLHDDGSIWRYKGTPCSGDSCWQMLDNNSRTGMIQASDVSVVGGGDPTYQLRKDPIYQLRLGDAISASTPAQAMEIWRYTGVECEGDSCPADGWQRLDNNAATDDIVVGGSQLFQHRTDGSIWRYTVKPCSRNSCPTWQMIDNKHNTKAIAAGGNQLFQLRNDESKPSIWRYTGTPCSDTSCEGWQMLDNNPTTKAIAAGGNQLFQLRNDGRIPEIWRYTGTPCSDTFCPPRGWQKLDNNPNTKAIAAGGNQLFQLRNDGRIAEIWRYTGTGWERLDNNPNTKAIAAGGNQLFQLRNDERIAEIWRYTGTGWERLDNKPETREIVATGNHLYQRRQNGSIWRYTGTPCTDTSCPPEGWQMLDNNLHTKHIAAENQSQ